MSPVPAGSAGRGGIDGLAVGGGSGARPPLRPCQPSAWWDGVSHVVTPPAREIVT